MSYFWIVVLWVIAIILAPRTMAMIALLGLTAWILFITSFQKEVVAQWQKTVKTGWNRFSHWWRP